MPSASSPCPWLRGICFGKRELVPPLSTVLSVTMTQIVSTLASSLRGRGTPATPSQHCTALRCDHSSQTTCSRWTCCRSSSPLSPGTAVFSIVFGPLEQQCQQEAASTKVVSPAQPQVLFFAAVSVLYKLMDIKTSWESQWTYWNT